MSYGYIAKLSEKVERQHVRFYNRSGSHWRAICTRQRT